MAKVKKKNIKQQPIIYFLIIIILLITAFFQDDIEKLYLKLTNTSYALSNVPAYSGKDYVYINDNIPEFSESDLQREAFEEYSELDFLGRANTAYAKLGKELMPTEKRGAINSVKPTGWHTVKYDFVDGKYLYNRCHLIGFQLAGENANEKNLITCTRQMNTGVMLDLENEVADYIKSTGNHVMYRVTPVYEENNDLATGVEMEAYSVEDEGKGVKFNVFVYNVQDKVKIDYKTGESTLE